jgi:hypothetical protein
MSIMSRTGIASGGHRGGKRHELVSAEGGKLRLRLKYFLLLAPRSLRQSESLPFHSAVRIVDLRRLYYEYELLN